MQIGSASEQRDEALMTVNVALKDKLRQHE